MINNKIFNKNILLLIVCFFSFDFLYATHNRAGEITYEQLSAYTYRITLITYTYTLAPADRPEIDINLGDGTTVTVDRSEEIILPDYYKRNKYVYVHTYPGTGTYVITMEDPNRNEGVLNIPNSVNIMFAVKTILQINANLGQNNSPIMLNKPIDKAAKNQIFVHNPNAYDPDGDSLSYKIAVCLGDNAQPIPTYQLPSASIDIRVDPISGDYIWNAPTIIGIYNIAMEIEEWRQGIKIGSIIRDIQVEVVETDNNPPVINPIGDLCVTANNNIGFTVTANDIPTEQITLTSTGGVYSLSNNPAVFPQPTTAYQTVSSNFSWDCLCEHVRNQPYLVIFKAIDDNPDQSLVDYENVNIKIVGPATENVNLVATNKQILIQWDANICPQVAGYHIYRKNHQENFTPSNCQLGVPEYLGFENIASVTGRNTVEYIDDNNGEGLTHGYEYCYMIVAYYPDGALSYASAEVCAPIISADPIMLQVSVEETGTTDGVIHLEWMKPIDFDPIATPGPYRYSFYPSNDLDGSLFTDPFHVYGIDNNSYDDENYNTKELPRIYKIGLFNQDVSGNWHIIGVPERASSSFLVLKPGDNQMTIEVEANVPWENYFYEFFRKNNETDAFELIGQSDMPTFTDFNLINGSEYCYKVKCTGKYGLSAIPSPLINYTQELCAIPLDTVPSCPPDLAVINNCDSIRNELTWTNPNNSCADDVVKYNIYYANTTNVDLELLTTINDAKDTTFIHYPETTLAACYIVTAIDSFNNESAKTNKVCADNCEYYKLPNTFTPDGNGVNDIFKPFAYQFVEKVDIKIYNRWGVLVYETTNPDINWDGKNIHTKQPVPNGVYFYVCDVWEYRIYGLEARNISGFINVFVGDGSINSGK